MLHLSINKTLISNVKEKRGTDPAQQIIREIETVLELFKNPKNNYDLVPVSCFNKDLGILESLTKYLHENKKYRFTEIAKLLNRDQRTIWVSYHNAQRKHKHKLPQTSNLEVPLKIFANRKLSPLESLIVFLHSNFDYPFSKISEITGRSYQNIWRTYQNTKQKKGEIFA